MARVRAVRSRMGRRKLRRLTDWISGSQGFDPENPVFVGTQFFEVINLADLEDHDDRVTVVRMVGECYFKWRPDSQGQTWSVSWGLYRAQSDASGTILGLNPGSQADADSEDWMFRRTVTLSNQGCAVGDVIVNDFSSAHYDVRVMRKLEGLQQIIMAVALSGSTGTPINGVEVGSYMRSLVKLA